MLSNETSVGIRCGEGLPVHDATALTEGGDLARIRLQDQLYTLRITRAGKLILTK
ncbi:hemin uptake protein HemP [Actibacterium ureilyticum]|uniref:hemin uptake protein HemP n=1 Tax=Actibacterium ureilyticum TaxID=1590614 RepID=UPI0015957B49|nr:hemin uptake protein HemP [Actibacterium ureilyticum]